MSERLAAPASRWLNADVTVQLGLRGSLLALFVPLLGLACAASEPEPTYLPENGAWTYAITGADTNTCSTELTAELDKIDLGTTYFIDYDLGDTFQIELGANDVTCVIEAEQFTCSEYELFSDELFRLAVTWSGEFSSTTQMSGTETWSVTCMPDQDCSVLGTVPCARSFTFDGEYAE